MEQGLKIVFALIETKIQEDLEYLTKIETDEPINLNLMTTGEMNPCFEELEKLRKRHKLFEELRQEMVRYERIEKA